MTVSHLFSFRACSVSSLQLLLSCRKSLERAGPAFIKWGQWAATRKDLFSPDFCHTMEALHSNAPSHSLEATQLAIKRAFNQDMGELFKEINTEPIASGSIGQVYKARLSEASSAYAGVQPGLDSRISWSPKIIIFIIGYPCSFWRILLNEDVFRTSSDTPWIFAAGNSELKHIQDRNKLELRCNLFKGKAC